MRTWFTYMLIISSIHFLQLPKKVAKLSLHAQELCVQAIPKMANDHLISAIVCGYNGNPSDHRFQVFLSTGLYHLLVVSGSHLAFLLMMLAPLKMNALFQIFLLASFAIFTGLQPPVLRALLVILFNQAQKIQHAQWSSMQIQIVAAVVSLCLFPEWIFSTSWQLSVICGAALCVRVPLPWPWNSLFKTCLVYLFIAPVFLVSYQSLISILCNWLLAPVLGLVLFPLSCCTLFFHDLGELVDPIWSYLVQLLETIATLTYLDSPRRSQLSAPLLASYCLILLLGLHLRNVQHARSLWQKV